MSDRATISARFLLATPPSDTTDYALPAGFKVTKCPTVVAHGARRIKGGAIVGGTSPRWSAMTPRGGRLLGLAARGW